MGLTKKNRIWHYDFWFKKTRYQGSTHCTNHEKAKTFLTEFKHNLALEGVGLVQRFSPPILAAFLNGPFWDSIQQNITKPNTLSFYQSRIKTLSEYVPFTQLTLDKVDELAVQAYKDSRLKAQMAISSINAELKVLRKCMIFADTCGFTRYKRIRGLPGEKGRTFVVSGELEKAYLAAASYPLREIAILMLDLGLRPSEAVGLKKSDISGSTVTVQDGKTVNAHRSLPQTDRTREVFELCAALFPDSEWVFPGLKGKHYSRKSLSNLHNRLRNEVNAEAVIGNSAAINDAAASKTRMPILQMPTANTTFPPEFVLYSFRHTAATRLAESGAPPWVIMRFLGHSSIKVSERYIHPGIDYMAVALHQFELYGKMLRGELHDEASLGVDKDALRRR